MFFFLQVVVECKDKSHGVVANIKVRGILLKILMSLKDRIGEGEGDGDGERNYILGSENINLSPILFKVIKLTLSLSTKKV